MDKKRLIIGVGIVAVLLIAFIAYAAFTNSKVKPAPKPVEASKPADIPASPETIAAMKKAGPIAGTPLYGVHAEDMPTGNTKWSCKDAAELRQRAAEPQGGAHVGGALPAGVFWQSNTTPNRFIYYEYASRVTVACDGVNVASTVAPDRGISSREEVVKFDQPHFGDWERNGKFEALVFRGQCASGPCLGLIHLVQMDGTKIRKLAEFNADGVDTVQMSIQDRSRMELQVHATCYTRDYIPAFEYVAMLDYGGPQILTLVPPQQIKLRSPELLERMRTPATLIPNASKEQDAYAKLQMLVYRAYKGEALQKLMTDYQKIVSVFPNGSPNLQCDPPAILKFATEGK